jgi:hypothetical protein
LPDGCKPKSQFGYISGLGMENVGMLLGQLEHFWPYGTVYIHFVYAYILWSFGQFSPFWYIVPRNIWQLCVKPRMTLQQGCQIVNFQQKIPIFTYVFMLMRDKFWVTYFSQFGKFGNFLGHLVFLWDIL